MTILSSFAAAAVLAAAPDTIVVSGTPLKSLEAEAAHCKKSACGLRRDIITTIRYAEGLFRIGRYTDSRRALTGAIRRNRADALSDPLAMTALYEATETVARHDGDPFLVRDAIYYRARVVRQVAPQGSAQQFLADLDVADLEAKSRQDKLPTDLKYTHLAARANEAGQPAMAARIALHHAIFAHQRRKEAQATELLQAVVASKETPPAYSLVARALSARFARQRGDKQAVDKFVSEMVQIPQTAAPILIWSAVPAVPQRLAVDKPRLTSVRVSKGDYAKLRWADIGFSIRSDGIVEAPEVLRSNRDDLWVQPILTAIGTRRYVPFGKAGDVHYRIERWTLASNWDAPAGTLGRRRIDAQHYEPLQMSADAPRGSAVNDDKQTPSQERYKP